MLNRLQSSEAMLFTISSLGKQSTSPLYRRLSEKATMSQHCHDLVDAGNVSHPNERSFHNLQRPHSRLGVR